jgi:hypothetical protein
VLLVSKFSVSSRIYVSYRVYFNFIVGNFTKGMDGTTTSMSKRIKKGMHDVTDGCYEEVITLLSQVT